MSFPSFTKTYHTAPYSAIAPTQPALSAAGKVVLITGGNTGVGLAIAHAFVAAAARAVVITGRNQGRLDGARAELTAAAAAAHGTAIHTRTLEVSDAAASARAVEETVAQLGALDVLVLNAGVLPGPDAVGALGLAELWAGFETNVKGVVAGTQAFVAHAARATDGGAKTLINVASAAAHIGQVPGNGTYAATKAATVRLMEYLQLENPATLRVFSIHPGLYETGMVRKYAAKTPKETYQATAFDDIALAGQFCVWLAAPKEADFLKGRFVWANWDVDEMKDQAERIQQEDLLNMRLSGWGA